MGYKKVDKKPSSINKTDFFLSAETYASFLEGEDDLNSISWNGIRINDVKFHELLRLLPYSEKGLVGLGFIFGLLFVLDSYQNAQKVAGIHYYKSFVDKQLEKANPHLTKPLVLSPEKQRVLAEQEEEEIEKLFEELFPGKYEVIDKDEDGNPIRRKIPRAKKIKNNKADEKSEGQGIFKKIINHPYMAPVAAVWNTLGIYAYGYWIANLLIHMLHLAYHVHIALVLGVAAIPVVAITLYQIFKKPDYAAEANKELAEDTHKVLSEYYLRKQLRQIKGGLKHFQTVNQDVYKHNMQQLGVEEDDIKEPEKVKQDRRIDLRQKYPEAKYISDLKKTGSRSFIFTFVAIIGGYIGSNAIAWPITDVLSVLHIVAHVSPFLLFALTLTFALAAGYNTYLNNKNADKKVQMELDEINRKSPVLQKINALEYYNNEVNKRIAKHRESIANLIAENNKLIEQLRSVSIGGIQTLKLDQWSPTFKTLSITNHREDFAVEETSFTLFKRYGSRALAFVVGAEGASFVVRSLLAVGLGVALVFPATHIPLLATILATGLVYGIIRAVHKHKEAKKQKQEKLINNLDQGVHKLENEKEAADKLEMHLINNIDRLHKLNLQLKEKVDEYPHPRPQPRSKVSTFFSKVFSKETNSDEMKTFLSSGTKFESKKFR